jgi:uncharacterized membrane-anchored protein
MSGKPTSSKIFYWLTIIVSNTLGTALGDFLATTAGVGFERGTLVFAALLAVVAAAHFWLKRNRASTLFWAAYVLTRPFGATLGDTLTKSRDEGGLALGRISASLAIAAAMRILIGAVSLHERRHAAPT